MGTKYKSMFVLNPVWVLITNLTIKIARPAKESNEKAIESKRSPFVREEKKCFFLFSADGFVSSFSMLSIPYEHAIYDKITSTQNAVSFDVPQKNESAILNRIYDSVRNASARAMSVILAFMFNVPPDYK